MRLLTTCVALIVLAPPARAAEKDQEKARQVAEAFIKALAAKDLDAALKAVDVPFTFGGTDKPITEPADLKTEFAAFLKGIAPERVPDAVGMALSVPTVRKALAAMKERDRSARDVATLKHAETVKGDAVYLVQLLKDGQGRGAVIVRIKAGKAAVVWIHK